MEGKYILYAEDDLDDQEMLAEMLSEIDGELRLVCVPDGYDVLHYLESLQPGSQYPCMVILDINMPGLNGIQTLKVLKGTDKYRNLPVVMFSTSNSPVDKKVAQGIGANEFITKPVRPDQLDNIARRFAEYCHAVPQRLR